MAISFLVKNPPLELEDGMWSRPYHLVNLFVCLYIQFRLGKFSLSPLPDCFFQRRDQPTQPFYWPDLTLKWYRKYLEAIDLYFHFYGPSYLFLYSLKFPFLEGNLSLKTKNLDTGDHSTSIKSMDSSTLSLLHSSI